MLTLKDFIKNSLAEIADGLREFEHDYADKDFSPFPEMTNLTSKLDNSGIVLIRTDDDKLHKVMPITFDVAVSASTQKDAKGGAGISVLAVKIDGEGGVTKTDQSTSHISFKIPLKLPN